MYWNLRFVRTNEYTELREVYYNDSNQPMGHSAPCLLGEDKDWPLILSHRVVNAAILPTLKGSDFVTPEETNE